ncbi:hypothetical protein L1049_019365 [Liquidambar formosana]|uniref:DUF4220 domain-containing protein n=1 Tax=Liquidambar formosana TaxID=63359 RepID=A0AAP0S823_LIQFO
MQIFPESVRKLWNEWDIRVMVPNQPLFTNHPHRVRESAKVRGYQGDSESVGNAHHPDSVIMAFWAPFLLVHLGGPDTITAFSLEDNELWLRHFLGLLVQVGVAFYVFLRSWTPDTYHVTFLAIPMFIAGIIKYGERTWALMSASSEHFRDSLVPPPNPGLDYIEIMDKYGAVSPWLKSFTGSERCRVDKNIIPDARIFHEAYYFFKIFRRLYADLIFSFVEIEDSIHVIFRKRSAEEAFSLIEVELGFIYDVLYTKASTVYSRVGGILRLISFISSVSAFAGFLIIVNKHRYYSRVDIVISYILFAGAIALEIYALILLLFSDWTMLWLSKHKNPVSNQIYRAIYSLRFAVNVNKRPGCPGIQDFSGIDGKLDKYHQIYFEDVSAELKECIFQHIKQKAVNLFGNESDVKEMCSWRGNKVIEIFGATAALSWSVEGEFDESILIWHIATDLCYRDNENRVSQNISPKAKISKLLSDYMLYLLLRRPLMLPKGIGQIRFRDTVAEAEKLFEHETAHRREEPTSLIMLQADSSFPQASVKGSVSKSSLFNGSKLAKSLLSFDMENACNLEWKWEMISNVWVEMLCYAANQCRWNQHANHLARGGQLITHVSLLMAHLGITEQLKVLERECMIQMPPPMAPSNNSAHQRQRNHWNPPDTDSD